MSEMDNGSIDMMDLLEAEFHNFEVESDASSLSTSDNERNQNNGNDKLSDSSEEKYELVEPGDFLNDIPYENGTIKLAVCDKFGNKARILINQISDELKNEQSLKNNIEQSDQLEEMSLPLSNAESKEPDIESEHCNQSENLTEKTCNASVTETAEVTVNYSTCHYSWETLPKLLCSATKEYQPTELYENFTKGCQWSPDGTCLLVPSEDFRLRVYELPRELYSGSIPEDYAPSNFAPALTVKEGGLIYDACWYPFMSSWDPPTCCFLSTSKESPVHLWDAFNSELRATYRAYNQVDEIEAAISVQFVNSGSEIWCGFKNALRIFDTNRPTRQLTDIQFKQNFPNARGLVSCIRENPAMPGLVAFGTYAKCVGLYKDGPLCVLQSDSGITQIEFSTCGTKLYSVSRRSNEFLCWDLRNPGVLLYSLQGRESDTNQRIQFTMTPDGSQIVSGGTDGNITVWDVSETESEEDLHPKHKIEISKDCINGSSLHRTLPILATSSGQRICNVETKHRDNSVRLWWLN